MTSEAWSHHLEDPASFTPAQLTEGGSLPAVWAARWSAEPASPALLFEAQEAPGRPGRWCTAGELESATRRAAARLAAAGLAPGERMVWSAAPTFEGVVACLGALRLGAVVVPANLAYTQRELGHVAGDVRPAVAVVERREQAGWLRSAAPGLRAVLAPDLSALGVSDPAGAGVEGGGRAGTTIGGPGGPGGTGGTGGPGGPTGSAPGSSGVVLDRAGADDPALVVFTSGTTGVPKGAVLSHGNLLAGARALAIGWHWHPDDRLVLALPLFHVHGLCAGLFGTLAVGASAVVLPKFSAEDVLDTAEARSASLFFGVPTMYHRLLASGRAGELARLRLCVSGSAPLPAPLWEALRAEAGVAVLERYGMTETMLTLSNPYDGERRPGSVGFPLPGVEHRLAPLEEGDGGASEEGQLLVAGPTVFGGYWERPAATEAAFDGRWFRTGDVVGQDADGYLSILGRRKDLILSGGFNVYPAEVEDVLLSHPGVAEVAVAGEPSDEWGETVAAWVVTGGGSRDVVPALEALAAERLAPYKRPRRYRIVEALPRNAMGKVQRDRLGE